MGEGFFLPEFAFSPDELDAVILGLGWVQQRADPALAQGSERALAKILSARKNGPATNDEPPALLTAASVAELKDPPQVALLRDAIRRQRKVAISHEDTHGTLSDRTIWPNAIVYFDDVHVLAACCERGSAFRHYRVDRLQLTTVSEERYPGRRQSLARQWRQQDRDWRSMMTVSDTSGRYPSTGAVAPGALRRKTEGIVPFEWDRGAPVGQRKPTLRSYPDDFGDFTDPGFRTSSSGSGEKRRISYDESRSMDAVRKISKRLEYDLYRRTFEDRQRGFEREH